MQAVVAAPKPTWATHPPRPIGNNLSSTNALVSEPRSKLVIAYAHGREPHVSYAGCGSGLVTGGAFSGGFLGGGNLTGSAVGDTGSSSGMTVYLRTGSPICATAELPWWMASVSPLTDVRQLGRCRIRQPTSAAVVVPHANHGGRVTAPVALQGNVSEERIAVRALRAISSGQDTSAIRPHFGQVALRCV
jgi:hypothetical protein